MEKAKRLRELLAQPGPIQVLGVYDCISAKVAERTGYPAAAISGAAVAASLLGYPDVGLQTMPEILNQARNIARCVDIPVTVDADTGYGNALNLMRAVREFETAGLAGMMFEDQTFPKKCGHFEGKKVIPVEEMVIKIQAACEARRGDFVIIARTDSRAVEGLEAAIERSQRYCEAGADIIQVDAMLYVEEMRRIAREVPKPTKANLGEGGKTPMLSVNELAEMGFKVISNSGLMQRSSLRAMLDLAELFRREGTAASAFPSRICSLEERSELLRLADFYELEERLYGPLLDSEKSWRKELEERAAAHQGERADRIPI